MNTKIRCLTIILLLFSSSLFSQKISHIVIQNSAKQTANQIFKDIIEPNRTSIYPNYTNSSDINIVILCDSTNKNFDEMKDVEDALSSFLNQELEGTKFKAKTQRSVSHINFDLVLKFDYSTDTILNKFTIKSIEIEDIIGGGKWGTDPVSVTAQSQKFVLNSAIIPGWGQLRLQKKSASGLFFFSFVGAASFTGVSLYLKNMYKNKALNYLQPPQNLGYYEHYKNISDQWEMIFYSSAATTGVIYLLNITNTYLLNRKLQNNIAFYPVFNNNYSYLTLQLKF